MSATKPLLLTIGDPNGIGPEIATKAAIALADDPALRPVLVGDAHVIAAQAARGGRRLSDFRPGVRAPGDAIEIVAVDALNPRDFHPGTVAPEAGAATVAYLQAAVRLAQAGQARAIVGCPHSETAINASGRPFSGYPNLLAELAGSGPDSVFLMLVGDRLRIVHTTLHERLADAIARLTPDLVVKAALAAAGALRRFGINSPRLGVFGINPHAGEGGLFGDDDDRVTVPAVARLRAEGLDVEGPIGADLLLGRDGFDAFVAIFHDQGHIPIKLVAGRTAAGLSVGGPIVFSSVGHGAAFDIAGRNEASPDAVLRALALTGTDFSLWAAA